MASYFSILRFEILVTMFCAVGAAFLFTLVTANVSLSDTSSKRKWISFSERMEFQAVNTDESPALRRAQRKLIGYSEQFIDGSETILEESSQAWRLLGLYVDCGMIEEERRFRQLNQNEQGADEGEEDGGQNDEQEGNEANENENEEREEENDQEDNAEERNGEDEENQEEQGDQEEADGQEGEEQQQKDEGEQEEADGENNGQEDANQQNNYLSCRRYLLWAAYADLDYQGGGLNEYQIYDHERKKWDDSLCTAKDSTRCVKMDCHLSSSHYKLLGFFKEYDPEEFLTQLNKYQGSCLLDENEYEFMENARDVFPQYCTQTNHVAEDGSRLYYATKPGTDGGMGIGLYEDKVCTIPYDGETSVDDFIGYLVDVDGSEQSVDDFVDRWNNNLRHFKTCQPCQTYTLSSRQQNANRFRALEDAQDENNGNQDYCDGSFNQCMYFATQTEMTRASYDDMTLATQQGTIVRSHAVRVERTWWSKWGFLVVSILVFLIGLLMFCCVAKRSSRRAVGTTQPLLTIGRK